MNEPPVAAHDPAGHGTAPARGTAPAHGAAPTQGTTPAHGTASGHGSGPREGSELTRLAVSATLHCLTGCAIGEVLGMVISTAAGWGNATSIAVSVLLAFFFGYGLTVRPVLRSGVPFRRAVRVAFASDTLSIVTMEVVDNAVILAVPSAMDAGLGDALFWGSLAVSLVIAFAVTVPVNRALIARGRGHAVVHQLHAQ